MTVVQVRIRRLGLLSAVLGCSLAFVGTDFSGKAAGFDGRVRPSLGCKLESSYCSWDNDGKKVSADGLEIGPRREAHVQRQRGARSG